MAASNAALAQGFLQGFNTMENHYRNDQQQALQQRQEQRAADGEAWRRQTYQDETNYNRERDKDATNYDRTRDTVNDNYRTAALAQNQNQWNEEHALRQQQFGLQQQQAALNTARTKTHMAIEQMNAARQEKQQKLEDALRLMPTMEFMLKNNQQVPEDVIRTFQGTMLDPTYAMNPNITGAVDRIAGLVQSGNARDVNNPQTIQDLNTVFADQIGTGIGEKDPDSGETITSKRIVGIEPRGPKGKLAVRLGVEYIDKDGKAGYREAPVTNGRTAADDDTVMYLDAGEMARDVLMRRQLYLAMNADPEFKGRYQQLFSTVRQAEQQQTAGSFQANYLRGMADIDKQEASVLARIQTDQNLMPEDREQAALQVRAQAEQMRGALRSSYAPYLGQDMIPAESMQPQQQGGQQTPKTGDVIEGYRFKGGDPSDQRNWEPVNGN